MKKNLGLPGRILRLTLGLIILGIGWYYQSWWGLLGFIPIVEAIFSWCPFMHFCGKACGKCDDKHNHES